MSMQRKLPRPRKLDQKKVLALHAQGYSTTRIAMLQNVANSTVYRFLERLKPEIGALEEFRTHRSHALTRVQAKSLDIQEKILDSLDEGLLTTLSPSQKGGLLNSLNIIMGTSYDKERLETGQSTQNISTLSRMMDAVVENIYAPKPGQPVTAIPKANSEEKS